MEPVVASLSAAAAAVAARMFGVYYGCPTAAAIATSSESSFDLHRLL
jgi:hypothetical protein